MVLAVLCATAGPAAAQSTDAARDLPAQAREMRAWLMRIHEAAGRHNFQGTFVVSGGGAVASAHIAHYCEGPSQYERSESLDGPARFVFRHDDVVTTLWPAKKVALVEQRTLLAQFPALLSAGDDRISDFYEVQQQGHERIAGREAGVLLVTPRDRLRYGWRLWSDQASGLLLRADVLGEHNEVLESSAFSDVVIGVKAHLGSVLQPMKRLEGYRVLRPALTPTRLEDEGWAMRQSVPGFRAVSCVKRPLSGASTGTSASVTANASTAGNTGADAGDGAASVEPEPQVLQTIYSDGLTYVSLFIEPFDPTRRMRPMLTSVGPTQTLMQQQGDWWITVVGDVPAATLRGFAKGLERVRK